MSATSWGTWLLVCWAALILAPLWEEIGPAIGRFCVQLEQARYCRERKRERFERLQFEFACERAARDRGRRLLPPGRCWSPLERAEMRASADISRQRQRMPYGMGPP